MTGWRHTWRPVIVMGRRSQQYITVVYFNLFVWYHSCAAIRCALFVDCRLTVWPSPAGFPAPWVASLTQDPLPRKPTLLHAAFLVLYNRSYPGSKPSILVPSDLQWLLYLPPFLKLQSSTCCPQSVLACFECFLNQRRYLRPQHQLTGLKKNAVYSRECSWPAEHG